MFPAVLLLFLPLVTWILERFVGLFQSQATSVEEKLWVQHQTLSLHSPKAVAVHKRKATAISPPDLLLFPLLSVVWWSLGSASSSSSSHDKLTAAGCYRDSLSPVVVHSGITSRAAWLVVFIIVRLTINQSKTQRLNVINNKEKQQIVAFKDTVCNISGV